MVVSQEIQEKSKSIPSWRDGLTSMSEKLAAVLKTNISEIEHDVQFLVGPDKEIISCHKFLLRVASPVFQAMFSKAFKASDDLPTVEIPDVDVNGFQNILTYVYTGEISVEIKDAATTMYAAHKYNIPEVVLRCLELLNSNLSIDNAVTIYQTAAIFENTLLLEKAKVTIVQHFGKVMKTEDFLELSRDDLCNFIKMDIIAVRSEVELFNAILNWGKHQCTKNGKEPLSENLVEALVNVVDHIRFPTMTAKEFATAVEPTGILCLNDHCKLYKYFSFSEEDRFSIEIPYNKKRRINHEVVFWAKETHCLLEKKPERRDWLWDT